MVLTSDHYDASRYLATKGSEPLNRLIRLDTETGEYTQLAPDGSAVEGVCDRLFIRKTGTSEWARLPLAGQPQ